MTAAVTQKMRVHDCARGPRCEKPQAKAAAAKFVGQAAMGKDQRMRLRVRASMGRREVCRKCARIDHFPGLCAVRVGIGKRGGEAAFGPPCSREGQGYSIR